MKPISINQRFIKPFAWNSKTLFIITSSRKDSPKFLFASSIYRYSLLKIFKNTHCSRDEEKIVLYGIFITSHEFMQDKTPVKLDSMKSYITKENPLVMNDI